MTLFFTATLAVSIVGLLGVILLKRWELSTGRVVSLSMRPKVSQALAEGSLWLEHIAPALLRQWAERASRYAQREFHRLVALGVIFFEKVLERALTLVRRNTQVRASDPEASAFLKEVSAHKKALQQMSAEERVLEE